MIKTHKCYEFITTNGIGFYEGRVIEILCSYRTPDGTSRDMLQSAEEFLFMMKWQHAQRVYPYCWPFDGVSARAYVNKAHNKGMKQSLLTEDMVSIEMELLEALTKWQTEDHIDRIVQVLRMLESLVANGHL